MPFIGNQPALSYTSFAKQDFSTSATTTYTLDNPVANANELALFINFVRQEPTTAYSASGTTLTLTSATSASDDMYCVYLGKAVQTVNPPNASVGASQIVDSSIALGKLSATGTKDATTFLRGDNTFASAGGANTPAISVSKSSGQSIATASATQLTYDTELFDTDGEFASNTWTVGTTGKYLFHLELTAFVGGTINRVIGYIHKNGISQGEVIRISSFGSGNSEQKHHGFKALSLTSGDTITVYMYQDYGSNVSFTSVLTGFKLVE